VLAGLGNSVYHPADLTILSHRVGKAWLGRGFAVHAMAGSIGYAITPAIIGPLAVATDWRFAIAAAGAVGVAYAVVLFVGRRALETAADARKAGAEAAAATAPVPFLRVLTMPVIVLAFAYFALSSFANNGLNSFGVAALTSGFGLALTGAALVVSLTQSGNVLGTIIGGFLADRTSRHHVVAMAGMAAGAALFTAAALLPVDIASRTILFMLASLSTGITQPSRDVLVRQAAPTGALGKVFGVVYSGFDLGSLVAPLVYGTMLDNHHPQLVFVAMAAAYTIAIPTVLGVSRQPRSTARPAGR
jgi:MFS family permease